MGIAPGKILDYGVAAEQIHLGVVPDTEGAAFQVLKRTAQSFSGIKEFSGIVDSPNSGATVEETADDGEVVTHQQLHAYDRSLRENYVQVVKTVLSGEEIELIENGRYRLYDPATGAYLGELRVGPAGSGTFVVIPPPGGRAPDVQFNFLPGSTKVIPNRKIRFVGHGRWY